MKPVITIVLFSCLAASGYATAQNRATQRTARATARIRRWTNSVFVAERTENQINSPG